MILCGHAIVDLSPYGYTLGMETWDIMESQVSVGRPREMYRPGWRARLHDTTVVGMEQPYWRANMPQDWIQVSKLSDWSKDRRFF